MGEQGNCKVDLELAGLPRSGVFIDNATFPCGFLFNPLTG